MSREYLGWLNDPEVARYLEVGQQRSTLETIRAYLRRFHRSRTDVLFAIIERESGRHIGNVTLNRMHPIHGTADTGLMIGRKDLWGRGYAVEAWRLLLEHAFRNLGLRKVVATVVADNTRSLAALKKLGFQAEGVWRHERWAEGAYRDVLRLGVFRQEFEGVTADMAENTARRRDQTRRVAEGAWA